MIKWSFQTATVVVSSYDILHVRVHIPNSAPNRARPGRPAVDSSNQVLIRTKHQVSLKYLVPDTRHVLCAYVEFDLCTKAAPSAPPYFGKLNFGLKLGT